MHLYVSGEDGESGKAAAVTTTEKGDRAGYDAAVRGSGVPPVQRLGTHIERGRGVLRHHCGPAGESQQPAGHHQLVR